MKKLISLILALTLSLFFVACTSPDASSDGDETTTSEETVLPAAPDTSLKMNITVLSGTTGMGAAKLIADKKNGATDMNYEFTVVSDATQISAGIVAGTVDIAAVPTNLASTLYKKTSGGVRIIAVNTLGVLYLLENGTSVNSIADLRGKTIYVPGAGTNPEYILKYILQGNGLTVGTDVTFSYEYSTPDTLATAVAAGLAGIALLPEPKVTVVKNSNAEIRTAIDLTPEWEKLAGENTLAQGCMIVRKEFAETHKAELDKFLEEYSASVAYIGENTEDAATLIADAGILPKAAIALKAIPNCNITYIDGADMKASLNTFYSKLFDLAPDSIGGALPDDGIYYIK